MPSRKESLWPEELKKGTPDIPVRTGTLPTQVSLSRLNATEKRRFLDTLENTDPALHALLHSDEFRRLMSVFTGALIMDHEKFVKILESMDE